MKLFTKEIDKKLAAQYHLGADLNAQVVVAKIFNPYGNGRWYLINSDPSDPDYLWAIVQIGDIVEIGSVSRRELETLRVGRFGFPLERDLGFSQRNAQEVYNGVKGGKTYAEGGVADEVTNYAVGGLTPGRWYKDSEGVEYKFIGKVDSGPNKDQLLFTDGEKKMYKNIDDFGEKPKENKLFGWFAKGGEVLKKYGFETIDDAVKALKNGEISTTKFMDILYEYEKKSKRKLEDGGKTATIGEVSSMSFRNNYDDYEMVVISKELDKDGGKMVKDRFMVSAHDIDEAKKNATDLWKEQYGQTDLSIVKVMSAEAYKHNYMGKMADGGATDAMSIVNEIAKLTGLRPIAVAEWGDKNNINLSFILKDLKSKKIKGMDLMTAIAGEPNNKYQKELLAQYSRSKMAMGGKTKFSDKVNSIQKSLLKRKKVAPSVQKDYGKTYNKAEAKESATRIVGAMTAKERLMAKKKK